MQPPIKEFVIMRNHLSRLISQGWCAVLRQRPVLWGSLLALGGVLLLLLAAGGAFAEGLGNPFEQPTCNLSKKVLEAVKTPMILFSLIAAAVSFIITPIEVRFAAHEHDRLRAWLQIVLMGPSLFTSALLTALVLIAERC